MSATELVLQQARRYIDLFTDVVAIAARSPVEAWRPIGSTELWPDDEIRGMLTAAIVASLQRAPIFAAADHLLDRLNEEGVQLVVRSTSGARPDVWARRTLWAIACAHTDGRL